MSLAKAMDLINKEHGSGSVMRLGDNVSMNVEAIPTGILELDICLGIGGIPRGRIVEVFGNESAGKSSLAMHIVKEAQEMGLNCAYVDAEHALDPEYAVNIGVNPDDMIISQPDYGEQALDIVLKLVESGEVGLIIVDSVAALTPRAEIQGDIGDSHVGLQARLMSQALRKITGAADKNNTTVLFINQLREKIGVMFGNPETTTGGNALKFYASVRLDIRRNGSAIKDKEGNVTGNHVKVKVVKNKLAPPFRLAMFDIMYGEGVSKNGEIVDLGVEKDIIQKSGSWYAYGGAKIAQGREGAKSFLADNPEVALEIETKIKAMYGIGEGAEEAAEAIEAEIAEAKSK